MIIFSLGLSRFVPLLLWASVILVAGRALHDGLAGRNRLAAKAAFVTIVAGGVALAGPFAVRSVFLVGALDAHLEGRWNDAVFRWSTYRELGGEPSLRTRQRWAEALIAIREYREAEALLIEGLGEGANGKVRTSPEIVFTLGVCRYYAGRWAEAERTLRVVDTEQTRFLRDYLLGRLAEHRKDRAAAEALYEASLRADPSFFPPLYQLVRLSLEAGDRRGALRLIEESGRRMRSGDTAALAALKNAAADPMALPADHEFIILRIR